MASFIVQRPQLSSNFLRTCLKDELGTTVLLNSEPEVQVMDLQLSRVVLSSLFPPPLLRRGVGIILSPFGYIFRGDVRREEKGGKGKKNGREGKKNGRKGRKKRERDER